MLTYLIFLVSTLFVSTGAAYLKNGLKFQQKNSKSKSMCKSAFDVPSLFFNNPQKDSFYSKVNFIGTKNEKHSTGTLSLIDSSWEEDLSRISKNLNQNNYRYTRITKRMTLVITH